MPISNGSAVNLASPGAIGGTTPAAGTFSTLTVANSPMSFTWLKEAATNSVYVPTSNLEAVLRNSAAAANVLVLWNPDSTGYSAAACRDHLGNERAALGWGNADSGGEFANSFYIQVWSGSGVPGEFRLCIDGIYGPVGSDYRAYHRMVCTYDETFNVARFLINHLIPVGGTQYPALEVECTGNAQAKAKIVQNTTDSCYQLWKDASPSRAISIGLNLPGAGAIGDDMVFAVYTGSAWVEKMRLKNGASGTASLNLSGLPTSASGLSSGDVWNNAGVLTIV